MILCYANLLCIDRDPLSLATSMTAVEARALLLRSQDAAVIDDPRWARASFLGTGFREGDGPYAQGIYRCIFLRAGLTLAVAPAAGLGFAHEGGTMGDEYRLLQREKADERQLVELVAEFCQELHGLPVTAEIDSFGEWQATFETSYRRRIAYGLGFHASLRAGSRACFEGHDQLLAAGTVAQLDALTHGRDEFEDFSLRLNLLARLRRMIAHEHHHGAPWPGLSKVQSRQDKLALLKGRLGEVTDQLTPGLNTDGQFALRALHRQLHAERNAWQVDISPVWGEGKEFSAPAELLAPS